MLAHADFVTDTTMVFKAFLLFFCILICAPFILSDFSSDPNCQRLKGDPAVYFKQHSCLFPFLVPHAPDGFECGAFGGKEDCRCMIYRQKQQDGDIIIGNYLTITGDSDTYKESTVAYTIQKPDMRFMLMNIDGGKPDATAHGVLLNTNATYIVYYLCNGTEPVQYRDPAVFLFLDSRDPPKDRVDQVEDFLKKDGIDYSGLLKVNQAKCPPPPGGYCIF